ncbi:MAG: hypothetical protein GX776_01905 [Oxalobacter sp.]|nr:hypothetical protein [Oxalobacter sp.]
MSQIHDNRILSYTVDLGNERIVFDTEYHAGAQHERTAIVFGSVCAHAFENEDKGSIIFDIEAASLEDFIEDNRDLLGQKKRYGWPLLYASEAELLEKMREARQQYFVIDSSFGLYGWVLAETMEIEVTDVSAA